MTLVRWLENLNSEPNLLVCNTALGLPLSEPRIALLTVGWGTGAYLVTAVPYKAASSPTVAPPWAMDGWETCAMEAAQILKYNYLFI